MRYAAKSRVTPGFFNLHRFASDTSSCAHYTTPSIDGRASFIRVATRPIPPNTLAELRRDITSLGVIATILSSTARKQFGLFIAIEHRRCGLHNVAVHQLDALGVACDRCPLSSPTFAAEEVLK
jgi:hypothetical protein